jgi:hypothetical protein
MNIFKFSREPTNTSEVTKVPAGIWLVMLGVDDRDFIPSRSKDF